MNKDQIKKLKKERKQLLILGLCLMFGGFAFTMIVFQFDPFLIAIGSISMFFGFIFTLRSIFNVKYKEIKDKK